MKSIAIDIDGTINNFNDVAWRMGMIFSRKFLNKKLIPDTSVYDLQEAFGWTKEEFTTFWNTFSIPCYLMAVKRQEAEFVIKDIKKNNVISLVTAREKSSKVIQATISWLLYCDIVYDYLFMGVDDKTKFCEENGIYVLIEDKEQTCKEASKVTNVICFDNHYNRNFEGDRIYNWSDLYTRNDLI